MNIRQWQWVPLVETSPGNHKIDELSDENAYQLTRFNKYQLRLEDSRSYYYSSMTSYYWRRDYNFEFKYNGNW
jgi:hypothetical protein